MIRLFSLLLLALTGCVHLQAEPTPPRPVGDRPNVVIFFLDDAGYGDFAHNGNPTIRTPQISGLARDGVNLTQFYVSSPACSASRYSLLTGRYPIRSGLGSWVIGPGSARHLHPQEVTLAEGLKTRGYHTGIFGKWHLGNPNAQNNFTRDALPLAHGFDEWVGTNVSHDYINSRLIRSDPDGTTPVPGYTVLAEALPSHPEVSASLTGRSKEAVLSFIERHREQPFFAYVPLNMPHLGLYASEAFRGTSRGGLLGDVMEEIDDCVGAVRETLAEHGLTENTLIIFSSDNGPWLRFRNTVDHPKYGEARHHVGYAYPFRDGKGSIWEGGYRTPGVFCWPGTLPPHTVVQEPASTLDILPTVFALAGVKPPENRSVDGRDIRGLLRPDNDRAPIPEFRFFYSDPRNQPVALREGPWKMTTQLFSQLQDHYGFHASREQPLLFQVEQDLGERFDRASETPKQVQAMRETLESFETQARDEGSFWD